MDFDFKTYMLRKGVARKISLDKKPFVALSPKKSLKRWADKLQQQLIAQLKKNPAQPKHQGIGYGIGTWA